MRLVLLLALLSEAKVDLFVSKQEMNRTLGLNAVLRYVEKGEVNEYAVTYPVLVRPNISSLNFLWQSHAQSEIGYQMKVEVEGEGKRGLNVGVNVPSIGVIPTHLSPLVVRLACDGVASGEFLVTLSLRYNWPSEGEPTQLSLRRRKICKPGPVPSRAVETTPAPLERSLNRFPVRAVEIFYIAMGCVVGFVIVVASLIIAYFVRLKKPVSAANPMMVRSPGYVAQSQPFLRPESPSAYSKYSADMQTSAYSSIKPRQSPRVPSPVPVIPRPPLDVSAAMRTLQVPVETVDISELLQEGTFGELLSGTLSSGEGKEPRQVLIKTVKKGASSRQRQDFLNEGLSFYGIPAHPNVAQAVASGILYETHSDSSSEGEYRVEAPLLCYSQHGFGNLSRFLSGSKSPGEPISSTALRTQDIVYLALQLIRGVQHLHRHGVVHRDIAARNCWMNAELALQLCDTGLSRDLFPLDYHCLGDNENRPVKWLALEALQHHRFSSATDVWAFGVTLWELLSGGWQPYSCPEVDPEEMASSLAQGLRLPQPYNCPDELYGVMFCCWGQHPQSRPTFDQLLVALQDFYSQLTEYI